MSRLQKLASPAEAERRLICFPHAGGVPAFYGDWGNGLPHTEVHAVCYPGRAQCTREPFAGDLRRLAQDIAGLLLPLNDRPLALFGHSMGSLIAFEAARTLHSAGVRLSHLFVSGAHAPQTRIGNRGVSAPRGDRALAATLVDLGGTGAELLADPTLLRTAFPYVAADFQMVDRYAYRPGPELDCPVTAVVGDADPAVTPRDIDAWAERTTGAFRSHVVPGAHFYLDNTPPWTLIADTLTPSSHVTLD